MKKVLAVLGIIEGNKPTPEFFITAEITKLNKRAPRTSAEKAFAVWLKTWAEQNAKVVKGGKQ